MDNLAKAIDSHSHYGGADDGEKFWETMYDKHWDSYAAQDRRPNYKDFIIWCEDLDLVPDDAVFEDLNG